MTNNSNGERKTRGSRTATERQRLLSLRQAETEYGIPYTSLRDVAMRGAVPIVRLPGSSRIWFLRSDLDALIAQSREHVAA